MNQYEIRLLNGAINNGGKFQKLNAHAINSVGKLLSLVVLIALVLSGCDSTLKESGEIDLSANFSETDACTVAMARHEGDSSVDRDIRRYQARSQKAERKLAYLGRLGWSYIAKARQSFDPGYYKIAEQTANCMLTHAPDAMSARLLKSHVLHNLHRFKEAELIAGDLVEQRGEWYDYGIYGDVLMEQGRLDEAVTAYQIMVNQYPGPQSYIRAAHIRWLKGDIDGAAGLLVKCLGAMGTRNKEAVAWVLVRLSQYTAQLHDLEQSVIYLDVALSQIPDYAPALLAKGRLNLALGDYSIAVKNLTKAAQLNPLPEYRWALIEGLKLIGRIDDAKNIEKLMFENGAVEDRRTFALYLESIGQHSKKAFELGMQEIDVRADVFTFDAMAWVLRSNGDLEGAYDYSQEALSENTPDARLYYHAAVLAYETARYHKASEYFKRAVNFRLHLLPSERQHLFSKLAAFEPSLINPLPKGKSAADLS